MKSTCLVAIILFALLAIPLHLRPQEQQTESATTVIANPVPLINQPLVPDAIKPGSAEFTLTVHGTGFVPASLVKWNGIARATKFVNSSRLAATILSADIAKTGTASVTVSNPGPGGGASNPDLFTVTNPTGAISLNISAYRTGSGSQSVAVADFNGDRRLDLAIANLYSNTVSVLLGNGDGTFQQKVDYGTGLNPASVAVGDFNGDGKPDLAVATASGSSVGILLGNGDGTFQAHVDYPTAFAPQAVAVGDFNGDGKLDLATANLGSNGSGTVSVLLGNGDGTFQPHVDYDTGNGTGNGAMAVAVGDFNKDGHLDLVVTNSSGSISILLGNGDGSFGSPVDYAIPAFTFAVAAGDFNGDGKLDLAVASFAGGNNLSILLGNGDGTFKAPVEYAAGGAPYAITVGDFNGDGKLDLAIVNGKASVLFGNGNGTFQTHVDYPAGSDPLSLAVGDFNGDGKLDLVVANYSASGNGTVSILLQGPTVTFSKTALTFSNQMIGTSSAAQTVTLTNTGYLVLKIAAISIRGMNAADFSQATTCGSALAPGGSCGISVIFKPTAIGPRTTSLTISDNAVASPQSISLKGTGVVAGPNATLSTATLRFIPQLVGTTSAAQTVKLTDYGTANLTITTINTNGDFFHTNTCDSTVAAGASCTISVTFKPTQQGTRTGTLSIADNASGSPQTVTLGGTGALSTTVTVSPTSLSFSCFFTCYRGCHVSCSPPQAVWLTDAGNATLYINGIGLAGSTKLFSQTNTCDAVLAATRSCSITVGVRAACKKGTYTGTLEIEDTGTGSPQTVALTENMLNDCF